MSRAFRAISKRTDQKGFSLIELMIVVAIIGILSALAVPKFQNFQAKARQSEAKMNLSSIHTAEVVYQGENGFYTSDLNNTGWVLGGAKNRYTYSITANSNTTFTALADANANAIKPDASGQDQWNINESRVLCAVKDSVSNATNKCF